MAMSAGYVRTADDAVLQDRSVSMIVIGRPDGES
jgi:hypothetical protein